MARTFLSNNEAYDPDFAFQAELDAKIFGNNFQYARSGANLTTTSKTLLELYSLTTAAIPAGTYRISSCFAVQGTNNNSNLRYAVSIDGVTIREGVTRVSNSAQREIVVTEDFLEFTLETQTPIIRILAATSAGTLTMYFATLSIWRVI